MVHRHSLTWALVFGVIVLMFLQLPPMAAKQDAVVHTYSALVEVDALAKQQFVEPIDDDRLVDGAIRGMMFKLDPYSGYISPQELPAFDRRNRGVFSSVGVELGMQSGRMIVIAPIEGSPAAKGGVLPGDELVAIDAVSIDGQSVFEVEERLVGPPGTRVRVTLRHLGERDPVTLTIARGPVHLKSVRGFRRLQGRWDYLIDPPARIGYVGVASFQENTIADFDEALRELLDNGVKAIVLDLRFNPGGLMPQAVAMADRFLEDGVIVSTVTRRRAVEEYRAEPEGTIVNVKLVVLVNGSSASAAEIVAGALQARGRAIVVGQRTFGKGSVQHLIRLKGHPAAVKLTVAYYRLPDGRIIHRTDQNAATDAWGIRPEIEVALSAEETEAVQTSRRAIDSAASAASELIRDRQLAAALNAARESLAAGPM